MKNLFLVLAISLLSPTSLVSRPAKQGNQTTSSARVNWTYNPLTYILNGLGVDSLGNTYLNDINTLVKLDNVGKQVAGPIKLPLERYDYQGNSIALDSQNNVIVVGFKSGSTATDGWSAVMAKYDSQLQKILPLY